MPAKLDDPTPLGQVRLLLLVVSLSILVAPVGLGQLTTGSISGTVTDASGGVLPGVELVIINVATSVETTAVSDEQGRYRSPNLRAGPYALRVAFPGFQTYDRQGLNVTLGRSLAVDIQLQVGQVSQTLTVLGDALLPEKHSATVSTLVDQRTIEDLPLNGRDLTQLVFLKPGVVQVPQRDRQGIFSGMGDKFSVNGARQTHNVYLLDGVSGSDLSGNPQGVSEFFIGAETIQEFQIITNNYSAEYESKAGAIVSAVIKSGTNQLHGTGFWYHRNDNLDATSFFANRIGIENPEFKRNQFGFSLGGPIVRDRTFFFTSYEGLRERLSLVEILSVPMRFSNDPDAVLSIEEGELLAVVEAVQPYLDLFPTVDAPQVTFLSDLGIGTALVGGSRRQPTRDPADGLHLEFGNRVVTSRISWFNVVRFEPESMN